MLFGALTAGPWKKQTTPQNPKSQKTPRSEAQMIVLAAIIGAGLERDNATVRPLLSLPANCFGDDFVGLLFNVAVTVYRRRGFLTMKSLRSELQSRRLLLTDGGKCFSVLADLYANGFYATPAEVESAIAVLTEPPSHKKTA
jgi:hypothetical protein